MGEWRFVSQDRHSLLDIGSFKYDFGQRRLGDPSSVVADIRRARTLIGWTPKFALKEMIDSVTTDSPR